MDHTSNLTEEAWRYISYLSFKMDCAREQEATKWRFLRDKAQEHYNELEEAQSVKIVELAKAMPKKAETKVVNMPKIMLKKDGSPSANNLKWFQFLKTQKLPATTQGPVTVVTGYVDGNPKSPLQVKDWLYGLGWKPKTFKFDRNKETGVERKIPQVRYQSGHDQEGELCDSVLKLKSKDPAVEVLDGITIINHRLGFFKSMLENSIELPKGSGKWWLKAEIAGLTNTLRFKHSKPLANLPSVGKAWGKEIRGCLVAPDEDHVLCGWDMVSLESNTKKHYMFPHDPAYVFELSQEGFDEHLDLAKQAGYITQEDIDGYNKGERPDIKPVRSKFKPVNYSAVYGIGAAGIVRDTGMSKPEAEALLKAYWERNWAVKKVASEIFTKETKDGKLWLKNPVSGFWYSLRYDKDIWSTTNQGTGVYCFDRMLYLVRKRGIKFNGQFHDEGAYAVLRGHEEGNGKMLQECVEELNEQLGLNVRLDIDYQYGESYAAVH